MKHRGNGCGARSKCKRYEVSRGTLGTPPEPPTLPRRLKPLPAAIANAVLTCHAAAHSIRVAFYGAAAVAYDRIGINELQAVYDEIAAEECARFEAALREAAVENEPNPVKCKWDDMNNIRG
ncbi:MAG: hypothetical protein LBS62_13755, partial [Clostridiales bacterium]|nr:hypothetical protein [Clostridiales bacterium]